MGIESFKASLRYAVRNRQTVTVGGGEYSAPEIQAVLAALDDVERIGRDLAEETGRAVVAEVLAESRAAEIQQARNERDAAHRARLEASDALRAQGGRLEGLERLKAAVGSCRAFDVSPPILQAFIRLDDDAQADTDRMAATLAPALPKLVGNTTRGCYWSTADGFRFAKPNIKPDDLGNMSGGYSRLDELMRLKGEDESTIRDVLAHMVLEAHK